MKTALNLFDKKVTQQFSSIEIDTIVYERNDDGLLLECLVETKEGPIKENLEISFDQWEWTLSRLSDQFLAGRLEAMVRQMVNKVDWIAELSLPKLVGRRARLSTSINTSIQYHRLRA